MFRSWPTTQSLIRLAALTATYLIVAWFSLTVAVVHGTVSPVWPLTGLSIASLTLWGAGLWPAITVGTFIANAVFAGDPLPVAVGIAIGNTLEALLGCVVLRRAGMTGEVSRVMDGIAIIAVALIAPLPSATGGVLSLTVAGMSPWSQFFWVWLTWWMGDFMGTLLIAPLMVAWLGKPARYPIPPRPLEFVGALAVTGVLVSFVFLRPHALAVLGVPYLPLSSFLFPPIVWAVLRLRPRETTMVVIAACIVSVGYTVALGEGPTIGRLLWLQMVLLCIGGGSLLMVGAMVERGAAQQELLASEVRFRTIFEQAAVGITEVRRDGRLQEVNRRLCEMLGYDREELLGRSFEDITVPAYLDEERRLLAELLAGQRTCYVIEKQYLRKDRPPLWVRVTSSLPDQPGSVHRISIIEDISRQQHAMAALQEAHAQLQFALEGARAGLWEWDIAADRIVWSEEYFRLTGLDARGPHSLDAWLSTLDPADRSSAAAVIRTTLERRERRVKLEFRIRHPSRGTCWLVGLGQVTYGEDGRPLKMVGLNVEITELKRAEEEAKAANRAKSMFLAAASHDLRQPVQAIVLLNAALFSRLDGHSAQTLVSKIGASLEALQRLLRALLDISRLDAGAVVPEIRDVELGGVLERLQAEYGLMALGRGLTIRAVRTSAWTRTDPTLLERIARNLIENALRYTERGRILLGCRRRGDSVRLYVIDTGIGIAREHQESVFQEFYQVGNPERDREKGLGLGLSIVSRLCGLLDIRLSLVSQPGKGSCFMLDLPAVRTTESLVPDSRPAPETAANRFAILVVDDDAMIRNGMAEILADWGCEVLLAGDATEAVGQVSTNGRCPNAILADYRLPGGRTGIEAARAVHRACGREIPAIIITGDTAPDRIAEAKASGFKVMHKPVQPDHLKLVIEKLRARSSAHA
ncbi:MAG: PAS domain S-box protein [Solirubrobacterales bacterium]